MISILIPTYEPQPEHLKDALDSLLAQSEQDWTAFIHDDASNIDVRKIVEPYLKDSRIHFERSEQRLGIGRNWNACMQNTKYDIQNTTYIQFLFQDDTWEPHYLQNAISIFKEHPEVGFVSTAHIYQFEDGIATKESYEALQQFTKDNIQPGKNEGHTLLRFWIEHELHPNIIGEPSFVMMKQSLTKDVGSFCEDMPQFLDVDYWIRCLLINDWYYLDKNGGSFRVHSAGASAKNDTTGAGIYDRLRCFERLLKRMKGHDPKQEVIAARNRALEKMAQKFFARVKGGKKLNAKGSGGMWKFCVKHPLLIIKTCLTWNNKR